MSPQIKTILYTTALSPYTRPVLRFTVELAKQHDAKIVLLHVVEPLSSSVRFLMDNYLSPDKVEELHREATGGILEKFHRRLETFCAEELGSTLEQTQVISEIRVVSGVPHEAILREADRCNADLITMGTHAGSNALGNAVLGSTTRRITLSSRRPVLIVPFVQDPDNEWPSQRRI
ncbi:MAG TPA: universal stress protein [Candidatus Competibacter sp.]|nr:universal stress protein [Candidatus Competibacteraceae bacterium]HRC71225.1 universal stress protein [Candidatus Competibacter sp.]